MALHNIILLPRAHAHPVHKVNSHFVDGPLAKGGGGRGGGGRGGGGSSGGGSAPRPRPNTPSLPPIIIIPGVGSGGHTGSNIGRPSSNSTGAYSSGGSSSSSSSSSGGLSGDAIIGIVFGALAGLCVLIVAGCFCFKSRRRRQQEKRAKDAEAAINNNNNDGQMSPDGVVVDGAPFVVDVNNKAQPGWFASKPPLEYYKQVPSTEDLMSTSTAVVSMPVSMPFVPMPVPMPVSEKDTLSQALTVDSSAPPPTYSPPTVVEPSADASAPAVPAIPAVAPSVPPPS
ncbi:hypothetical protein BGX33_010280 [Mortierella sp. NVP41]|nr:hypothetical protein BGX33_010280 [Mortierella sp. NVP41]